MEPRPSNLRPRQPPSQPSPAPAAPPQRPDPAAYPHPPAGYPESSGRYDPADSLFGTETMPVGTGLPGAPRETEAFSARRPEPPRYGPDPYAPPPPATPEGGYPPQPLSERVPRRGRHRSFVRGALLMVAALLLLGVGAAAAGIGPVDLGLIGDDDPDPTSVANLPVVASPTATTVAPTAVIAAATEPAAEATIPAPDPTDEAPTATAEPEPTRLPTSTPAGADPAVAASEELLPTLAEIGVDLPVVTEGERSAEDVALSFGDQTDAAARLEEWGWSQNVYREFNAADPTTADPNSTTVINVSLHRFANEEAATQAFTYFSDAAAAGSGLSDKEIDQIGNEARALTGGGNEGNLAAVYVREGPLLIRVGTFSAAGDPLPTAVDVARLVVEK